MTTDGNRLAYSYVTYLAASPEQVWVAFTDTEQTMQFWGHHNVSDWNVGSPWRHVRHDGTLDAEGVVLSSSPPTRLAFTFGPPAEAEPDPTGTRASRVELTIEPWQEIVRLTLTHTRLLDENVYLAVERGWPAVLANLKTLLETGRPLPNVPWEMPADDG